jgi:hypothetical protein
LVIVVDSLRPLDVGGLRLVPVDGDSPVDTYDRPFDDILRVQDDIAGEVAKALSASIENRPAIRPLG